METVFFVFNTDVLEMKGRTDLALAVNKTVVSHLGWPSSQTSFKDALKHITFRRLKTGEHLKRNDVEI